MSSNSSSGSSGGGGGGGVGGLDALQYLAKVADVSLGGGYIFLEKGNFARGDFFVFFHFRDVFLYGGDVALKTFDLFGEALLLPVSFLPLV